MSLGRVTYHGSLTRHHGPAMWHDWCDCGECREHDLVRHVLVAHDGTTLAHVRGESFT